VKIVVERVLLAVTCPAQFPPAIDCSCSCGFPQSVRPYLLTAAALDSIDVRFSLVRGVAIVGPFLPPYVHLLCEKASLCQLQSHFGGEVSIVAPTVGHDFFVFWKVRRNFVEFFERY
jgi:hypothetical protein